MAAFPCSRCTIIEARVWNEKWAGPAGATYACDVIWDYYGIDKLSDLTIHSITKRRAAQENADAGSTGEMEYKTQNPNLM
jgi:hypothetical protein|eukprot:4893235-Prymnesium_polylepis.1